MHNLERILYHKYITVQNKLYLVINIVWKQVHVFQSICECISGRLFVLYVQN